MLVTRLLVPGVLCLVLGACSGGSGKDLMHAAAAAASTNEDTMSPYETAGVLKKKGESATHAIPIDVAAPVMFLLVTTPGDVELVMTSPSGKRFSSHHPRNEEEGGHVPDMLGFGPGSMSMVRIETPETGEWTAKVIAHSMPDSLPAIVYSLKTNQDTGNTGPVLRSLVPNRTYHKGERLIVGASLLEHGVSVEGAMVQAVGGYEDGEPIELTLRDDGSAPDSIRGDGIYAGEMGPLAHDGFFELRIVAERPKARGAFRRAVSQTVRVSRSDSRLTGRYSDSTRDSDHDGVPDEFVIAAGVHVSEPARLGMVGFLSGPRGPMQFGRAEPTLVPAGDHAIDLVWSLKDLSEKTGPGPFRLDSLFLLEENDEFGPMYVFDNIHQRVYTTRNYAADELIYEPIHAADVATARGIDDNHDGRYDVMEVEVPIILPATGLYAWHVVIEAEHSGIVTQASGVRVMPEGHSSMRLPFPGACMAGAPAGAKFTIDFDTNFVPRPPVPPNAPQKPYEREHIRLEGVPAPSRFDPAERPSVRPKEFKTRDEYESFSCG
jgi:hypothetical protein